jgi:DNA-binding XRE family transcriptional regulator
MTMRKKTDKRKTPRANGVSAAAPPSTDDGIDVERVNLYRLEHGLTFKELGHRINVKPTTLYAFLRGRTRTKLRDTTAYRIRMFCATHLAAAVDRHPG